MISWGTYGRQRSVTAPLEALAKKAQEAGLSSPSIVVLGEVVQLRDQISWFEKKPLFGKRIVITRPKSLISSNYQISRFVEGEVKAGQ